MTRRTNSCPYRLGPLVIACLGFLLLGGAKASSASATNYILADPELKVVPIDSDPKESFLSLQLDSAGRLFAGGREALFVYEPDPNGLYQPRQLLYRFPPNSWIYDIAIRGPDLYVATHTAVYLIKGAVTQRVGLQPKRLLWGFPPLAYWEEHQGLHGLVRRSRDPVNKPGAVRQPSWWEGIAAPSSNVLISGPYSGSACSTSARVATRRR